MQATTVTPAPAQAPASPELPAAPSAPATVIFTDAAGKTQVLPVPMTREAISDLRAQREELSDQLVSASGRRRNLASQLNGTPPGPARSGLEQRIIVLDQRLAQLESDIAATGKQLSAAPLGVPEMGRPFRGNDIPDNVAAMMGAFTFLVLFPIAIAFARRIWKRGGRDSSVSIHLPANLDQRLERLEQGVDAIAIEIERVTEGQRFVTRLLAESQPSLKIPQERATASRE
jgi:hypothetical protein